MSYDASGIIDAPPPGYDVDEIGVRIGRGRADFDRATAALRAWTQFDLGWVHVSPRTAPITVGTTVAVLIRHYGLWSLNGCRIVSRSGSDEESTRLAFVYGTLTNHAEEGEERFEVSLEATTGDVIFRLKAVSRPRAMLSRLGYPLARLLQARFRAQSAAAMRRACER